MVAAERGWGCRRSRGPWARPAAGLTPLLACPTGAAVPGGGRAGAGPCGTILRAVPAPAWCHGGALWAAGRLCAGPGPGLCGGFAAALLPYHPACESRERGTSAGVPGAGWGGRPGARPRGKLRVGGVLPSPPEPQNPALRWPWTVPNCGCAALVTARPQPQRAPVSGWCLGTLGPCPRAPGFPSCSLPGTFP